jgi:hypothetical protein
MLAYAGTGAAERPREEGMAKRKAGGVSGGAGVKTRAADDEAPDVMVTTVRITRAQWDALRREAMTRALDSAKGERRPDASKLIREAIDEWLARRAR